MTPVKILHKYWKHNTFRPLQEEIIENVLAGNDTLAIMPTGGGKSVCFQIPALINPGVCIVVTPLIALMKDQVENLEKRGIPTLSVHSGLNFGQVKKTFEKAMNGDYKFLYVSPERLETNLFREFLPYLNINLIAVDEAHCISQWGYDFRPSYLKIGALREQIPEVPVIALTASATQTVQKDICDKLLFRNGFQTFSQSYAREALSYSVFVPPSKENKLIEILSGVPGSGIVYCRSRKRTKEIAQLLRSHHIPADFYHAGLAAEERRQRQDDWINNRTRIICCTNAFGMGIDKPDVRVVVHFDLPEALEYYYQEAGRAGRDRKKSYAVLLFHEEEINELNNQVAVRFPQLNEIRSVYSAICNYIGLAANKGKGLSFDFEIGDFIDKFKINALLVSSVLKILEQEEYLMLSEAFFSQSIVEFLASKSTLHQFESAFPEYSPIIKGLLRSYEGIFDQKCAIDEFTLARFLKMDKNKVPEYLAALDQKKIIIYNPKSDVPRLVFLTNRPESAELIVNQANIQKRQQAYEERLRAMIAYSNQAKVCRSIFINNYFGGNPVNPCGICDVCLNKNREGISAEDIAFVIQSLQNQQMLSSAELQHLTGITSNKLVRIIEYLKDEKEVEMDGKGKIRMIHK